MKLSDSELIARLRIRVQDETTATADILLYLQEAKSRKLDLEGGHPSMYAFARKELGYEKDQAYARFRAAELLDVDPRVELLLREEKLTVTSMMQIQIAFLKNKVTKERKLEVIEKVVGNSTRGTKRVLADCFPGAEADHESTKPLANDLTQIQFAATPEMLAKFEKLMDIHAHKNFGRRWDKLFEHLADIALEKPAARKPREQKSFGAKRKKISVHVDRALRKKAEHRCQQISDDGHRCDETHGLQIEHRVPIALGGTNSIENLEILCGAHNRYRAWELGLKKPEKPLDTSV